MNVKQQLKANRKAARLAVKIPKMRVVQMKTIYNRKKFKKGVDNEE